MSAQKIPPSGLPKDSSATVRINSGAKAKLKQKGVSVQMIIDAYLDNLLDAEIVLKWKAGPKK